jgi:hypothetical protein
MVALIKELKRLSTPGILFIRSGNKKIRIISSSNLVSSIQRILPELDGSEKLEVISEGMVDRKLRSLMCYIHKRRLEGLGYKITSSIKRWRLSKNIKNINDKLKWVVEVRNTYSSILIGIFEKEEMEEFLKSYYPCGVISGAIVSSNKATKEWYEVYGER